MPSQTAIRRLPWTCRWGVFGGEVNVREDTPVGFTFWSCRHRQLNPARPLMRGSCEDCPWWEAAEWLDEREIQP